MAQKLESLCMNRKYSDAVLRHNGRDYPVHRCIICPQSPVLSAACDGSFSEPSKVVIDVPLGTVPSLACMICYLYTGDYEAEEDDQSATEGSVDRDTGAASDGNDPGQISRRAAEEKADKHFLDISEDHIMPSSVYMTHANVFMVADHYNIPELMKLAVSKFKQASASDFDCVSFSQAALFVYQTTQPFDNALKAVIKEDFAEHLRDVLCDESAVASLSCVPELAQDMLRTMNKQREAAIKDANAQRGLLARAADRMGDRVKAANESHDHAINAAQERIKGLTHKLQLAQTEASQATQARNRLQGQLNSLVSKIDGAEECRHCGEYANVYVVEECTNTYSLRCVCKTRY